MCETEKRLGVPLQSLACIRFAGASRFNFCFLYIIKVAGMLIAFPFHRLAVLRQHAWMPFEYRFGGVSIK